MQGRRIAHGADLAEWKGIYLDMRYCTRAGTVAVGAVQLFELKCSEAAAAELCPMICSDRWVIGQATARFPKEQMKLSANRAHLIFLRLISNHEIYRN